MRTKARRSCTVNLGRWFSYAAAGAATALAASNDAEAGILYSGVLNQAISSAGGSHRATMHTLISNGVAGTGNIGKMAHIYQQFPPNGSGRVTQAGYFANFRPRASSHTAHPRATIAAGIAYASKLAMGANISGGPFLATNNRVAVMATFSGSPGGRPGGNQILFGVKWSANGTGFLGFEFNQGGLHYGWARVTMSGGYKHEVTLVDYAYGTVGQAITAGEEAVPEPATLALLALGAAGLLAVRKGRKRLLTA